MDKKRLEGLANKAIQAAERLLPGPKPVSILRESVDELGLWTLDSCWLGKDDRGWYLHTEVSAKLGDQAIIESITRDLRETATDTAR